MGKASQRVQAERRLADGPREDCRPQEGEAFASVTVHNFQSGDVMRFVLRRGDRSNNFAVSNPSGESSKAHGWAWFLDRLRVRLAPMNRWARA